MMRCGEDAFHQVPLNQLRLIPNGGQREASVPAQQQVSIGCQAVKDRRSRLTQTPANGCQFNLRSGDGQRELFIRLRLPGGGGPDEGMEELTGEPADIVGPFGMPLHPQDERAVRKFQRFNHAVQWTDGNRL